MKNLTQRSTISGFSLINKEKILTERNFSNILTNVTKELKKVNPTFNEITNIIKIQSDSFNKSMGLLNDKIAILELKKNETIDRLKEVEFPFGKIPFTINDAISFFLIGIAIGFFVTASLLGDAILLRKGLEKHVTKDSSLESSDEKKISILAPLWVEPHSLFRNKLLKFLPLLIPFVIFLISINFLTNHSFELNEKDEFSGVFIGNNINNQILYMLSYIISIFCFSYGYYTIIVRLLYYKKYPY